MHTEKATFTGSGGHELDARLELPEGTTRTCAIFAHCFTCSKETHATARISRALVERGIGVLRFDFTGLGGSGGDFANTDFTSNMDDLVAAAAYLRGRGLPPGLLVGHSLGGAAVLVAAARIPEIAAVATINAPSDLLHVKGLFRGDIERIEGEGEADVTLGGRSFRVRNDLFRDLEEHRLLDAVQGLRTPLLVFHAPFDQVVGLDNARLIFEAAKHPKSFVSLDSADHLISDPADSAYIAHVLAAWASRYLQPATPPAPLPGQEVEAIDVVRVQAARAGGLAQVIRAGSHQLRADEPTNLGGEETGPTPYDLLLAGLGACTAMTLRLYADRKGWPLEDVHVELRHQKIHAADCERCETQVGRIDRIAREVRLVGPLDPEQRLRLLEIADRCPVHRTLESEILIETTEATS